MNLQEFTERCEKPVLKRWVDTVVKKAVAKDPSISYQDIEHVLDYLHSDESPRGVSNLSWEQAVSKAEAWVDLLNKRAKDSIELDTDVEEVFRPKEPEGYRWVKLVGKSAFEREGRLMSHCIGSFHDKTDSTNYSLRDPSNNPHANLEIRESAGQIVQVKGKGNGPIHPKYIKAVLEFHEFLKMPIRPNDLPNLGYVPLSASLWRLVEELYPKEQIKYLTMQGERYLYKYGLKDM